jgi:adenosylcobinamide-phosphate synthase
MEFRGLAPSASLLLAGVLLDAIFGDPQVAYHPIRLIGATLSGYEHMLRRARLDGYWGGCFLFLLLAMTWVVMPSVVLILVYRWNPWAGAIIHVLLIYICFALRDLVDHVRSVQRAANRGDVSAAHKAIAMLVGRDIDGMDIAACRRAAIESLSENFVDGVLSAVFWYVLLGIPGLLLFKVASTMDSMVGYKTPQYIRFGWCGARLDDVMNYVPARLTWLLIGALAAMVPGYSGRKAWRVGLGQHAVLPGPNSGWSEAATAGALERRIVGPIWRNGALVTDVWIGEPADPPLATAADMTRAAAFVSLTGACVAALGWAVLVAAR